MKNAAIRVFLGWAAASLLFAEGCPGSEGNAGTIRQAVDVTWRNAAGVDAAVSSLTRTGTSGWNAGAVSNETFSGAGFVEFSTAEINTAKMAGLSSDDTNHSSKDIEFALYLAASNTLAVYESGIWRAHVGSYAANDVFRIEIDGGYVSYYRNGLLLYTSTATPSASWMLDTSLYSVDATITNGRLNAGTGPRWQNLVAVTEHGRNISKIGAAGWNAGASSGDTISGDGYVQFSTAETNTAKMAGMSNGDTDQSFADIDFGFYLQADGRLAVYENGSFKAHVGTYASNDVFRIQKSGAELTYYQNDSLVYTSANAATMPLRVDTSLYSTGATITDASVSPTVRRVLISELLSEYGDINTAIAQLGEAQTLLIIDRCVTLTSPQTIPGNIAVNVSDTGCIDHGDYTLVFEGSFSSPAGKLIHLENENGNFVFNGLSQSHIDARWWTNMPEEWKLKYARDSAAQSNCKKVYLSGKWTIGDAGSEDTPGCIVLNATAHSGISFFGDGMDEVNGGTKLTVSSLITDNRFLIFLDGRKAEIRDVTIRDMSLDGNKVARVSGIVSYNPASEPDAIGPQQNGIYNLKLTNIAAKNFGRNGIYIRGDCIGNNVVSTDNSREDWDDPLNPPSWGGLAAMWGNQTWTNCKFNGNGIGVDVWPGDFDKGWSSTITFIDCELNNNFFYGYKLGTRGRARPSAAVKFVRSTMSNNGNNGAYTTAFDVTNWDQITTEFHNTHFLDNRNAGLSGLGGALRIRNCVASNNVSHGFHTANPLLTSVDADGVVAEGNKLDGIVAGGPNQSFTNVTVTGNDRWGFRFAGLGATIDCPFEAMGNGVTDTYTHDAPGTITACVPTPGECFAGRIEAIGTGTITLEGDVTYQGAKARGVTIKSCVP